MYRITGIGQENMMRYENQQTKSEFLIAVTMLLPRFVVRHQAYVNFVMVNQVEMYAEKLDN